MPIRRPRGPKPVLRHVAFLESMTVSPAGTAAHDSSHSTFLTLRLLDAWVQLGRDLAEPDASAHRAAREAASDLRADVEVRSSLLSILDAISSLHEPDPQPLLPRVFALGKLFEQRGLIAQAGDVYATVARYVDPSAHLDLAFDAFMRQAFCLRTSGEFEWADQAYGNAASLAGRARDRARVIHARSGQAKVEWGKGNLPAADRAMQELAAEAEALGAIRVLAMILHDRAGIARHREDLPGAVRLAFEAFRRTSDDFERERVLMDLASFLNLSGASASARDALRILEVSARSQDVRWNAQIGLMELAAKDGSEPAFESYRRQLADAPIPAVARTAYLLDAGVGLTAFGHFDDARGILWAALQLAETSGQNQRIFEIEEALKALEKAARVPEPVRTNRPAPMTAPDDIALALRELLAEVGAGVA